MNSVKLKYRIIACCASILSLFLFWICLSFVVADCATLCRTDALLQFASEEDGNLVSRLKSAVVNWLNDRMDSAIEKTGTRDFFVDLYGLAVREIGLRKMNNVPRDKIVRLENGHLCNVSEKSDLPGPTQAVVGFAQELRKRGIPFLFVLEPHKGHKTAPMLYPGLYDYSNENADQMLAVFRQHEIPVLDSRELFAQSPETHYGMFYKADTHWNALYAFYVFRETAKDLEKWGIKAPEQNLEVKNYTFIGSSLHPMNDLARGFGRFYLPRQPEILPVPNWETFLRIQKVQSKETFEGPFQAPVFMRTLLELSSQNFKVPNRHKIFLVTDSMGRASVSYFALAYHQVEFRPLNYYEGFLLQEIETFQPEIVLMMMTGRNYAMEYMLTKEKLLSMPQRPDSH